MKMTLEDFNNPERNPKNAMPAEILGGVLSNLDYYQYKLKFPKKAGTAFQMSIEKAGKNTKKVMLKPKSICTTNSAKSWDLNSQGGTICIKV